MSYTVDLIVVPLPENDQTAWQYIQALRDTYYDDEREKASALIALHSALTARHPCLCSFADDDPEMDDSPWADGPMINNFSNEMGMLAITYSRVDEVLPFIVTEANALGIAVADGQTGQILRPTRK